MSQTSAESGDQDHDQLDHAAGIGRSLMRVVVGRVGRAHGLAGEVGVEVRTDDPDTRFAPHRELFTVDPAGGPPRPGSPVPAVLHVRAARWHSGRLLVRFAEVMDRTAAEALGGRLLEAEVDVTAAGTDPEEYHDLALIGLVVRDGAGARVGVVAAVSHLPAQDLLVVEVADTEAPSGTRELLVPFVAEIVPVVDLAGGFLVVDLPAGLDEPGQD